MHKQKSKRTLFKSYGDLLYSYLTKGQTERFIDLNNVSVQLGFNRTVSQDYIAYYIQVMSFEPTIDVNLLSSIRDSLRGFHTKPIYVDMLTRSKPHKIKWKSNELQLNLHMWKNTKKRKDEQRSINSEEGFSMGTQERMFNWEDHREASWEYYKFCEQNQIELSLTSLVFRIRIHRDDDCYKQVLFENIESKLDLYGIHPKLINTYVFDAISETSPFKHEGTKLASRLIADRVLSTEITSVISPLTQGRFLDGNLILGNDIKNRQLVKINTHPSDGSGTNLLIISSTGGGKSALSKSLDEQILALHDYDYIVDYEGREYTPLGDAYGATYLDFDEKDGRYYDPLRLATLTGVSEIDSTILPNAINGTYMLVSLFLGHVPTATQKKVLGFAIDEHARGYGVDLSDRSTWHNGDKLSIRGILPKLRNYRCSNDMLSEYGNDLIELVDSFELYFAGVFSYMFKNPISFEELREVKLLIIRFGGDTKADMVGEDSIDIQVKQLTTMLLMQELARYRRLCHQSFVIKLEELQRYLSHRGASSWVNTMYTGVRKCNGTMIGIINDPEKLKEGLSALINNSEYVIVGKTVDMNAMKYMFDTPKLSGCEALVSNLVYLKNCFLVKDLNGLCSIFHTEFPKQYIESDIYKTRDIT